MSTKILKGRDLELHCRFSEYGMNAKEWLRKCALMLPEIDERRIWAKRGFGSLFEYAAKLAGMSKGQVWDALRIVRKVEDKPALIKVIEEKGVNAVRPVVSIVTQENQEFWAEKARVLSKNELEVFVKDFRRQSDYVGSVNVNVNGSESCTSTTTQPVKSSKNCEISEGSGLGLGAKLEVSNSGSCSTIEVSKEMFERLQKIKGGKSWDEVMGELLLARETLLEQEKPEAVATESRHIPENIRKFVMKRDAGMCVFPGCTNPVSELHHTQGFSVEHVHDPDKIYSLCRAHHSLAHRGLVVGEEGAVRDWKVKGMECAGAKADYDYYSPRGEVDRVWGRKKQVNK